jgi:F-type H+-transporting ATPase subunit epsilon
MPMRCEIATQDRLLFEGLVDEVVAPGSMGEIGVLPHHAPLLTTLDLGILRIRSEGREEAFTIAGGVMEVLPEGVTVLADVGENVAEIDAARSEEARARAEALLKNRSALSDDEYRAIEAALRRSNLRLGAVRRFRGRPGMPRPTGEGD